MNTRIALSLLLLSAALPASAGITAGVDQTLGSNGFRGTRARASIDLDETYYLEPFASIYRSDTSSGTYREFGARFGYETGPLALGVSAAHQPKTNGYQRTSFGADATFSITSGGTKHGRKMAGPSSGGSDAFGKGLAAVDLGGAVLRTMHSDDFSGVAGNPRRGQAARASAFKVAQTDLSAFAGVRVVLFEASAEVTKSVYDKDLTGNNAREAQALRLSGMDSVVQGFPDSSFHAKLKWKSLPFVRPFASYTRTTFKLGAAPSNAYEFGTTVGIDIVTAKAAYSRYVQRGYADQNFFTLGASLNF